MFQINFTSNLVSKIEIVENAKWKDKSEIEKKQEQKIVVKNVWDRNDNAKIKQNSNRTLGFPRSYFHLKWGRMLSDEITGLICLHLFIVHWEKNIKFNEKN